MKTDMLEFGEYGKNKFSQELTALFEYSMRDETSMLGHETIYRSSANVLERNSMKSEHIFELFKYCFPTVNGILH